MLKTQTRLMFLYLGRRGLSHFALDLAWAAVAQPGVESTIIVSRQNEIYEAFSQLGEGHLGVHTFSANVGLLAGTWRIPSICQQLRNSIERQRPHAVIELMPHAWSPLIAPSVKELGVPYIPIIHDAKTHPGDYRSAVVQLPVMQTLAQADAVITLSGTVTRALNERGACPSEKIHTLFHPDLEFGVRSLEDPPKPGDILRLLFLGRIMKYKGLPIFLDMVRELRGRGFTVQAGVFGEGDISSCAEQLTELNVEVLNRWLTKDDIQGALGRFDAVVLSHIEASQSGVAATALGAGLPVIATPVGGLTEQIIDGVTGIIASRPDGASLADSAERLFTTPHLYQRIRDTINAQSKNRSMSRFVSECAELAASSIFVSNAPRPEALSVATKRPACHEGSRS